MTPIWAKRLTAPLAVLLLSAFPAMGAAAAETAASPDVTTAFKAAATELIKDTNDSRKELDSALDAVSTERLALVKQIEALRRDVSALQAKLDETRDETGKQRKRQALAKREEEHLVKVAEFLDTLTTEYRRAFETRITGPSRQRHDPSLSAVDSVLAESAIAERLGAAPKLLELAEGHAREQLGGTAFPGKALDKEGNFRDGTFAEVGPVSYFSSSDGEVAGLVVQSAGSVNPSVYSDFGTEGAADDVRSLVENGQGSVPVDVTHGAAIKRGEADETLEEHLRKGGITMIPLLALAIVCGGMAIFKLLSLMLVGSSGSEKTVALILAALRQGDLDEARRLAARLRKPLGPVIAEGIEHRDAPKEHVEEIMYERLLSMVPGLERLLAPLAVCASAAPLLGLLGTVTGMIRTFKLITVFGTGDAKLLSAGISEALVTTEVGLVIAIPALLIHAYLSRRVRKTIAMTQQSAIMFVNGLKLKPQASETGGADG